MSEGDSISAEISQMLQEAKGGDPAARERLFLAVHDRLRTLAGGLMGKERDNHTLQATALVNEACLRLIDQGVVDDAENRRYLFGAAVRSMRQVLTDHARNRNAEKRGGSFEQHPLDVVLDQFERSHQASFLDLDDALTRLEADSSRQREVVELRFFSGLSIAETAALLGVSHGTIESDWRLARAKLYRWLEQSP